jgi:hypothetical protein
MEYRLQQNTDVRQLSDAIDLMQNEADEDADHVVMLLCTAGEGACG